METVKKKFIKLRGDKIIWLVILLLALISIIAVYSSSSSLAFKSETSTFSFLIKQMAFVSIGFISLLVCYRIPLGWYRKSSFLLMAVSIGLLAYLPIGGVKINDTARWLDLGFLSFQPSELAKIAVILYLARILETSKLDTFKEYTLRILIPIGILCILCLYGSVSVTLIIGSISLIILVCARVKSSYILYTVSMIVAMAAVLFTIHSFTGVFNRIDTFTARIERHYGDEQEMTKVQKARQNEKDFQILQAKQAIQLGGVFGRGPGNSIKRDTLPHPYSDFIYATIIEEWGLFGGFVVIMLYIWLLYRCIIIARSCKKVFSAIVVMGLSLLITLQAMMHILVNIGAIPVTGQTLPLISLGGTSLVIMSCAFGIILSVNRTIEITVERDEEILKNEGAGDENSK